MAKPLSTEQKRKISDGVSKSWKNKTPAERATLKERLSELAFRRWEKIKALNDDKFPTCLRCAHFYVLEEVNSEHGECRRNPPTENGWPAINCMEYCGEFCDCCSPVEKKSESVILEDDPQECSDLDPNAGICNREEPCQYRKPGWECNRGGANEVV